MPKVRITGSREGLNKVQLNHLLRQHAGYGLKEAKRAVDQLLAGELVTIDTPDPESASAFCLSADAIGAVCNTGTEARESQSITGTSIRKTGTDA
jgi:hypothetical protein